MHFLVAVVGKPRDANLAGAIAEYEARAARDSGDPPSSSVSTIGSPTAGSPLDGNRGYLWYGSRRTIVPAR